MTARRKWIESLREEVSDVCEVDEARKATGHRYRLVYDDGSSELAYSAEDVRALAAKKRGA